MWQENLCRKGKLHSGSILFAAEAATTATWTHDIQLPPEAVQQQQQGEL